MAKRTPKLPPALAQHALCHPDRPHVGKGLCQQCFHTPEAELDTEKRIKRARYLEVVELHKAVDYITQQHDIAQAILVERLPEYAELHKRAAEVAAEKGDARPIEWALQSVKVGKKTVVEPPAKIAPETGVKVYVGVNIGGVPSPPEPAITVESVTLPPADV